MQVVERFIVTEDVLSRPVLRGAGNLSVGDLLLDRVFAWVILGNVTGIIGIGHVGVGIALMFNGLNFNHSGHDVL